MINLKERHLFPGGNTSKGFHSFYRYVLSQDEANRIICFKGGPGTGKSSMLKKLAAHFLKKGYTVEFHHCSSDNNSLDGIVVKELKIALVDGTSPHIVDPITPGAVDEIVNLGVALDCEKLTKNKLDIIKISRNISSTFSRAYKYLAAAKSVHDDWSTLNYEALDSEKVNSLILQLSSEILPYSKVSKFGLDRHLFSTAFTPNGIVSFGEELSYPLQHIHILKGGPGLGKTDILKYLGNEAQKSGYFVEYLHDPLSPDRIENIIIPELSTGLFTTNEISNVSYHGKIYNMEDYCNKDILAKNADEVSNCSTHFYSLLNKTLTLIKGAKKLHDDLEVFYIDAMDFTVVDKIYTEVLGKLEKYE